MSTGAWYTAGQGTLSGIDAKQYITSSNSGFAAFDDGTSNNAVDLLIGSANVREAEVIASTVRTYIKSVSGYTPNAISKDIIAFANNDQGIAIDGALLAGGTVFGRLHPLTVNRRPC